MFIHIDSHAYFPPPHTATVSDDSPAGTSSPPHTVYSISHLVSYCYSLLSRTLRHRSSLSTANILKNPCPSKSNDKNHTFRPLFSSINEQEGGQFLDSPSHPFFTLYPPYPAKESVSHPAEYYFFTPGFNT